MQPSPCPFCGQLTVWDGVRRYWPEGFPIVHECVAVVRVPNGRDFCPLCAALTWGEPCEDCTPVSEAVKIALPRQDGAAATAPTAMKPAANAKTSKKGGIDL